MRELTLDIHARHPRVLLEVLGNLVRIDVKKRRSLGQIDQLDSIVLRHMLAALNLNISGGKQSRVDHHDGNDDEHGQDGQNAAHDFAFACNERSGV